MSHAVPRLEQIQVAASAAILFLYFFTKPEVDMPTYLVVFGVWAASMAGDLWLTLANRTYIAKHERSIILAFAYRHLPGRYAAALAMLAESLCVVLFPAMLFGFDLTYSVPIAYFFSMLHAFAIRGNERFVEKMRGGRGS